MSDRVVVFVDYQNVYRSARRVYHSDSDPHWFGQIDPQALGEYLAQDSPFDRELHQVRVYRGFPVSDRDPKAYGASRKQCTWWEQLPNVEVIRRPLQYPIDWPDSKPNEKGIDVRLALDVVLMAQRNEYDVGILMSLDTDLKPALETVEEIRRAWGKPRAEVAAWSADAQSCRRLSFGSRNKPFCHWIREPVYEGIRDNTNYSA